MPRGLYRLHHTQAPHFITSTCYHRYPRLPDRAVRNLFVAALNRARRLYGMKVYGFVVVPEHVLCCGQSYHAGRLPASFSR